MQPYPFQPYEDDQLRFFTELGVEYRLFWEDVTLKWRDVLPPDTQLVEVSLFPKDSVWHADPRIRPTVEAILAELWNRSDTILLFRFDASDAKQHARRRLFRRWFEQLSDDWKSVSWHELESSIGKRTTPIALLIDDKLPEGEEIRYWLEAYVRYLDE